jgi:large subunit ribosomal protein L6
MKKELFQKIQIPEGVEVKLEDGVISVKGPEGENKRKFNFGKLNCEIKEGNIIIGNKKSTKVEKKNMNTIVAHIKNMIRGAQKKFEYKLKICHSHFPFTVKQEGTKILIKNFLGEKVERVTNIPEDVEMEIKKDIITIKSKNKELAGQASANLERVTVIKGRDKRVFQDGIYIIEKDGKQI